MAKLRIWTHFHTHNHIFQNTEDLSGREHLAGRERLPGREQSPLRASMQKRQRGKLPGVSFACGRSLGPERPGKLEKQGRPVASDRGWEHLMPPPGLSFLIGQPAALLVPTGLEFMFFRNDTVQFIVVEVSTGSDHKLGCEQRCHPLIQIKGGQGSFSRLKGQAQGEAAPKSLSCRLGPALGPNDLGTHVLFTSKDLKMQTLNQRLLSFILVCKYLQSRNMLIQINMPLQVR